MSGEMSRREFVKSTGAMVAGLAVSPSMLGAATAVKGYKKVRIGVVGGGFGCAFQWHLHPDCIVEAVSDLRPERLQNLVSVYKPKKTYPSLEELIKDKDVDAVAVFTGAPDHVRHCVACLKAGKHVICAVPAAMSIAECEELLETVKKTGLTYMMAETSYYGHIAISARKFFQEKKFGQVFYTEAEYHHAGLDSLFMENGKRTWRYGFPPMHYPTHSTAFITGITGERLVQVSCSGWGNDSKYLKDNAYKNPFWNETAFFQTDRGNSARIAIYWYGAHRGTERAQWYGSDMSFFAPNPNGIGPVIVRRAGVEEKDSAGFVRQASEFESYQVPEWHKLLLPEPMQLYIGHDGAEPFLTFEFIEALKEGRKPAVDIYESLAYTVPGIIAHKSALQGGSQMKIPQFDAKS